MRKGLKIICYIYKMDENATLKQENEDITPFDI